MVEYSVCYIMDHFIYSAISSLASFAYDHPLVTLILSVIITITMGYGNFSKLLCVSQNTQPDYDYESERGPHSWETSGTENQSPIDIKTSLVEKSIIQEQLMWNHYNDIPTKVTMENNGRTVILKAKYAANIPTISGADLFHSYSFESLCFHWGYSNTEGSEHTIDGRKYAMELQATHKSEPMLPCLTNLHSLIIAYVFQVAAYNPFFDPIVLNLHRIKEPGTIVEIPPFPLAWLCYQFKSGFFSYGGSNSIPPCDEGVEWFINPEPIAIGENQLMEFRSLLSSDGSSRIIRNSRPVQCLNTNRIVHYNNYERSDSLCSCDSQQQLSNANESDN
ncbi:carbonic anhydrase 1-like [Episyrphus balteatus]|uniref:carbonic anhydrase 1-like n=1 Tax=Episyrphus balteatus TaxID=286459 RepID=UPI002484EB84|nr:carbonic anhydrase 1-like [Episyrphus balteatus]